MNYDFFLVCAMAFSGKTWTMTFSGKICVMAFSGKIWKSSHFLVRYVLWLSQVRYGNPHIFW